MVHFALFLSWFPGGTRLSWEPYTRSFFWCSNRKIILRHSSVKKNDNNKIKINKKLPTERAFCCLSVKSGFLQRLKGFLPCLLTYRHTAAAEPARYLFSSCLEIFLVEFVLRVFTKCFGSFAQDSWSSRSRFVFKTPTTWPLFSSQLL